MTNICAKCGGQKKLARDWRETARALQPDVKAAQERHKQRQAKPDPDTSGPTAPKLAEQVRGRRQPFKPGPGDRIALAAQLREHTTVDELWDQNREPPRLSDQFPRERTPAHRREPIKREAKPAPKLTEQLQRGAV